MTWRAVIVESPFKGNALYTEKQHRAYLEECLRHCVLQGETPYASHKMLTDCLDDSNEEQRKLGMSAGISLSKLLVSAGAVPVFYTDYGWSSGMNSAKVEYETLGVPFEIRKLTSRGSLNDSL